MLVRRSKGWWDVVPGVGVVRVGGRHIALAPRSRWRQGIQTDYDLEVERDLHSDELAKVTALVAS